VSVSANTWKIVPHVRGRSRGKVTRGCGEGKKDVGRHPPRASKTRKKSGAGGAKFVGKKKEKKKKLIGCLNAGPPQG